MTWKTFKEINAGLFELPRESRKTTFWKLAGALVGAAGIIGAYLGALDPVVHYIVGALLPTINKVASPVLTAKAVNDAWDGSSHGLLRLFFALGSAGLIYVAAFALAAQERLDFRRKYAEALGMKFVKIRREHDVLDLTGSCRTTSTETFTVFDLRLSHIERRLQVSGFSQRSEPVVRIEGLPDETQYVAATRDDEKLRVYSLNFVPPLRQTPRPVKMSITEEISGAISMYLDATPPHPVLGQKLESVSLIVVEPIDLLELSVTFPYGYVVGGTSQISVRYLRTPTIHDAEEHRLKSLQDARSAEINNGRQTLKLSVDNPVVGLQYYLCWVPPSR